MSAGFQFCVYFSHKSKVRSNPVRWKNTKSLKAPIRSDFDRQDLNNEHAKLWLLYYTADDVGMKNLIKNSCLCRRLHTDTPARKMIFLIKMPIFNVIIEGMMSHFKDI